MYSKYKMYKLLPSGTIYKHESYTKDYNFLNNDSIIMVVINDLHILLNRGLFTKCLDNIHNDEFHKEIIKEIKNVETAVA